MFGFTRTKAALAPASPEARRAFAGTLVQCEITRVRADLAKIRHAAGTGMPLTVALAVQRLEFAQGQARLIARGDKRAILRQLDPAAYLAEGTDPWTYLLERRTVQV
ncbi:MAG TPA: hypothetical protein VF867_18795 [Arthrobacter sp.]